MVIRQLEKAAYAGRRFTARYQTNGYYDVCASESGFQLRYARFDAPVEKSFDDAMFGEWLEKPVAFGAFEGGELLGFVEGSPETWNNRFRISNICVFDPARRQGSVGTALMQAIERAAEPRAPDLRRSAPPGHRCRATPAVPYRSRAAHAERMSVSWDRPYFPPSVFSDALIIPHFPLPVKRLGENSPFSQTTVPKTRKKQSFSRLCLYVGFTRSDLPGKDYS